jgi:MFS family permease
VGASAGAAAFGGTAGELRAPRGAFGRRLWYRGLEHYPDTVPRVAYLGIVVVATVVLYYELYVGGAVAPSIIASYHMSFAFYVNITVVANLVGAFASVIAGLADRWGRANLVTYGLGVTGALVAFAVPNASSEWTFAVAVAAVGFVEGIILVATPALVRDFSPQLGRASAMGFWTLGPVVGSLVVSEVASHTLPHLHAWQDQFHICGFVGLAVFLVALVGLRELSPQLRDQLMVSIRDRALVEARAKGLDVEASLRRPWRQMLHLDVVGSAFAVSVFLLIYYAAVGFFVIYFTTIFGFTTAQANSIGNWFWAFDAGALIVVGVLSDWVGVRKPFMVVGGLAAIAMTILFLLRATQPHTGYYTFVTLVSLLAVSLAIAYAPWMASFTETVERHNPALTATGLAVWGWIIRIVVAGSTFLIPYVVSSMTPLVDYGAKVKALATRYAAALATVRAHPRLFAQLARYPAGKIPLPLLVRAVHEVGLAKLTAVAKAAPALKFLSLHAAKVEAAAAATPHQWQHWWWVCVAGEVVFLPLILVMAGRWRPSLAKRDALEHERQVQEEMARLGLGGTAGAGAAGA